MRAASRGQCIAVALGVACATGRVATATADAPVPEVRWTAPTECPPDAFTDALDRLLTGSTIATPIRVEATVERTTDGWSIRTDFEAGPGRTGQRVFQAPSCRTVSQAAALAIAIAVDPDVLDRWVPTEALERRRPSMGEGPSEHAGAPTAPAAPAVPEPTEPEAIGSAPSDPALALGPIEAAVPTPAAKDATRGEPSSRWRGLVGVAGMVGGGALPGPGLGVTAMVGVMHRGFRAELVGSRRFATQRAAAADPRVGGSFTQWWVGARGCGVPRIGAVELPLCAGLEGGRTAGRGTGLPAPRTSVQPWWAALVDAGLVWPVRRWLALSARATLAVPLLRQDFTITGLGVVHRVGPVEGRGTLGVELRWP